MQMTPDDFSKLDLIEVFRQFSKFHQYYVNFTANVHDRKNNDTVYTACNGVSDKSTHALNYKD